MTIMLSKDQTIRLTRADGAAVTRIGVLLYWGQPTAGAGSTADLDLSCLLLAASGAPAEAVSYRVKSSRDGSVLFAVDSVRGGPETITADLTRVSTSVSALHFVVRSYTLQPLNQISGVYCELVDRDSGQSVGRYDLTGLAATTATALRVARDATGWSLTAVGTVA